MKLLPIAAFAFALAGFAPASAATLVGDQLSVSYRYPDVNTVYPPSTAAPSTFIVGPGVESVVDVEGVTDIAVDFGARSLMIDFSTVLDNPTWAGSAYNGLLFQGMGAAKIVGATVTSTTMAGFDDSRLYFSGGDFGLDWQGLSYTTGTNITVDLTLAGGVPEPATWAMLLVGFAAVGAAARRRQPSPALA